MANRAGAVGRHHARAPESLIAEAARVARKAVIVKDHLAESPLDRLTLRMMDWVGNAPHGVALPPYNYASRETWRDWLYWDIELEE